ncbi:hypothetical protein [Georgenia yuyongxinii]|uniref:Sulfate permease n=1 Tax=Georgenia yuyongxinii TaxID=2589797 RepID=A0A552WXX1_9MICO|nr:hypothetical protein [Georgenia yuyongxinii]TRW47449.1 hypothetical protein FJ693_01220 [Georgenia yuyongxinii]
MVFRLSFAFTGALIAFCQAWMPTNHLVRWLYTDRGLPWGLPVATLLVPVYFQLGRVFQARVEDGGSGWWWLPFAWAVVNCLKFTSVAVRTPFAWVYRVIRRAKSRGPARRTRAAV